MASSSCDASTCSTADSRTGLDRLTRTGIDWSSQEQFTKWLTSQPATQKHADKGNCQAVAYSFVKFAVSQRLNVDSGTASEAPKTARLRKNINSYCSVWDPTEDIGGDFLVDYDYSAEYRRKIKIAKAKSSKVKKSKSKTLSVKKSVTRGEGKPLDIALAPKNRILAFGKYRAKSVKDHLCSRNSASPLCCDPQLDGDCMLQLEIPKGKMRAFVSGTPHLTLTNDLEYQVGFCYRKLTIDGHRKMFGEKVTSKADTDGHCFNWLHIRSKAHAVEKVDFLVYPDLQRTQNGSSHVISKAAPAVGEDDFYYENSVRVTVAPDEFEFACFAFKRLLDERRASIAKSKAQSKRKDKGKRRPRKIAPSRRKRPVK